MRLRKKAKDKSEWDNLTYPICNSFGFDTDNVDDSGGNEIIGEYTCLNCKSRWTAYYTLRGYRLETNKRTV